MAGGGAVYAARVTNAGELYLRREAGGPPRGPPSLPAMAAALQGQRKPQGSRRLMDINGPDDRTEVDSHETPYTAVGFLRTGLPLGSYGSYSMCSASQISKRTVLTAGKARGGGAAGGGGGERAPMGPGAGRRARACMASSRAQPAALWQLPAARACDRCRMAVHACALADAAGNLLMAQALRLRVCASRLAFMPDPTLLPGCPCIATPTCRSLCL